MEKSWKMGEENKVKEIQKVMRIPYLYAYCSGLDVADFQEKLKV